MPALSSTSAHSKAAVSYQVKYREGILCGMDGGDTISQKIVFETEREINHDLAVAAKAATPFLDVLASIRQP